MQKEIEAKLSQYQDAYLEKDLLAAKVIKHIEVEIDKIILDLVFGYPITGVKEDIQAALTALLTPIALGKTIDIKLSSQIDAHGKQGIQGLANVKNIIAVGSGKGGVGKSVTAVNLALALAGEGAQVGLLDADIHGPSQPAMLGVVGERPVFHEKSLLPIKRHGIQSMSIGYLLDQETPIVWRGPMIGKALQQLLKDTRWEALDYLIVDLPPGTGDIQLTLCQKIPVSGAVIVTTPQDLALLDVRRACEMFNKLSVPILGVIENMSGYQCLHCHHEEAIFGAGGGAKLAQEYLLPLLGKIPLAVSIREMTDQGCPPVVAEPDGRYAKLFYQIARKIAAKLSLQAKDYSARFPKIKVMNEY
ncbi:MAG TPA: iron-sulfur cluster carrier protein ApbC [Gammaproteobacteria bacterium]|nr:iron-sulfur cluster carrier protein ApbC [Gammaproteobacteria bacterium]